MCHTHCCCAQVLPFFETLGFKCPKRKGVADFLQEVTSRKDQAQYWCVPDLLHCLLHRDKYRT